MAWDTQALDRSASPRIDLHLDRREERRAVLQRSRRDLALLGGLALLVVAVIAPLTLEMASVRRNLQRVQDDAADTDARCRVMVESAAGVRSRQARWQRFQDARDRRQGWCDLLDSLSRAVPQQAYVDQLAGTPKEGRTELVIAGSAESMNALQAMLDALSRSGAFVDVHVAETAADRVIGPSGLRFKVNARAGGRLASTAEPAK